ncbi:STAS domain-containing protein, partial [Candidatus Peregrinibacteria bacterium]|nr:STAS domain-containing protein [Candidatus Peregrinibacteria bacterium]
MAEATITIEDLPLNSADSKGKVISISGQLDETNVDEKSKEIYKVLEENPEKLQLVFDLEGLEYMNSKSIGYLTDWYGKVAEKGGKTHIARAKDNIKDILQVVGLTQLIEIHDSLDEAKQAASNAAGTTAPATETPAAPVETP